MVLSPLPTEELAWVKESHKRKQDVGSSTFPYPPEFLKEPFTPYSFQTQSSPVEIKKKTLKSKSLQRELVVHEVRLLWAKGQVAEPVKTQKADPSLS